MATTVPAPAALHAAPVSAADVHDRYQSPLTSRYASKEMAFNFSDDKKFQTWRKLWVHLARAERNLGLPVTLEQIAELEAHITDIDYALAAKEVCVCVCVCTGAPA
jgi:hypothetical protein